MAKVSKDRVERVWQCVVCGAKFRSRQALRGHMKKHRGRYVTTHIVVDRRQWEWFKGYCREHGWTTCAAIRELIGLVERGAIKFIGPNPMAVLDAPLNVYSIHLGRPRSVWHFELGMFDEEPRCLACHSRDVKFEVYRDDGSKAYLCRRHGWLIREFRGYREVG